MLSVMREQGASPEPLRIGIAGAGGIGSNVAMHLVRSGVTCLKIVDFDRVEASNLNRQFFFHDQIGQFKTQALRENLSRIIAQPASPEASEPLLAAIQIENIVLSTDNLQDCFAHCPIIVEAVDSSQAKKIILETFADNKTLVVSASGIAGMDTDSITVKKLGNCHIVGDFITDCQAAPLYSHKVMSVAARMAECILSYLSPSRNRN